MRDIVNSIRAIGVVAVLLAVSAPTGAEVQVSLEPGIDRPGQDLRNFPLPKADPTLCRDACADDERCRAFTYVKPGLQGPSARCWLKHRVPASYENDCCVSGVKDTSQVAAREGIISFGGLEHNTNRGGLDYHSFDLPQADPALCQAECAVQPRCKAFTYVKPGLQGTKARCWLKHSVPPAGPDGCCISGVKIVTPPIEPTARAAQMPSAVVHETPAKADTTRPPDSTAARPTAGPMRAGPEQTPAPADAVPGNVHNIPSAAQQAVIDQYGWPQTFSLMFYTGEAGDAVVRHETWNYHAAGVAFTFINGRQGGRPTPLADIPGAVYPDYRPTRFTAGMTVTQTFNALPAVTGYYQEQMPGEMASTYWVNRLVMGFVDDVLVYVETRPRLPAGSEVQQ